MGEKLLVRKIKDGTVIDHIPSGNALRVLKVLGISGEEGMRISIVMNTDSGKLGKKDIIKIEGKELNIKEVNIIALIAPTATINIIRNYRVVSKENVEIPDYIEDIVKCANPNCITNRESDLKSRFETISKNPLLLKCVYCDRYTTLEDIYRQFIGEEG